MYFDVDDVRTADDALVVVKLMIFFELVDIERMLDQTHDPVADFINAVSADVIDFAATLTFEQFKEQTERLNELETYPQLVARSERIGYRINKVVYRGYHASALLLPDARILCAGGPPLDDTLSATIFTPPYLYQDGTTLAARPWIVSQPSVVHYGEPFYIGVDGATAKKIVSLIRPGATTHGLDENQRYVQQSFTKYLADKWLRTVLPDSNKVPPGDYLLFVVDSTASGNVPSVGKWVRIESQIDGTAPAAVTTLSLAGGGSNGTSANLSWTAPGDDGTSGTATEYDLRYRDGTPMTESNFASSNQVTEAPPRPSGSAEQYVVNGLSACVIYWFGVKTRDERTGVWSPLSNVVRRGGPVRRDAG